LETGNRNGEKTMTKLAIKIEAIASKKDLNSVKTETLLETYNKLTGKTTKKFSSRAKGIEQLWAVIQEKKSEVQVNTPVKGKKPFRFNFNFPLGDEIRPPKEGSGRHQVFELLKVIGGVTFDEVMAKTGWSQQKTYEAIRLVHYASGYQIRQDATTGKIKVIEPRHDSEVKIIESKPKVKIQKTVRL
jgi:hypothetical protein